MISSDKRVGYVLTSYPTAISQTFIRDEIRELRKTAWTVVPMSLNRPPDCQLDPAASYLKDRSEVVRSAIALAFRFASPKEFATIRRSLTRPCRGSGISARKQLGYLVAAQTVVRSARKNSVDHIHCHFGDPMAIIASLAHDLSRGSITWSATIHGPHDFFDESKVNLSSKIPNAKFIASISNFTRTQICRQVAPEYWSKVKIVRCGIDFTNIASSRSQATDPVVLSVGRLVPEKGQQILLEAVAILRDRSFKVIARLIGDGPSMATLTGAAADLGIEDRVQFLGNQTPTEVARALGTASIFCSTSFAEGLPVSIMEAMRQRVPVVTTAINGIPELIEHGVTGFLVPTLSPESVANAIQRVLNNDFDTETLTDVAFERVRENHNLEKTVKQLSDLFSNS